jgi:hypothetical protein
MPRLPILLWPLLVGSTLLLTGVLIRRATSSTPAASALPTPSASPDPAALAALDRTIALLQSLSSTWFQTELWQKATSDGLKFEAEGQYLSAPGQRLRCEVQVRVGKTRGQFLTVCDGTTLWQMMRASSSAATLRRISLTRVLEVLSRPEATPQLRQEILGDLGFSGMLPLLRILRQRLQEAQLEKTQWQGYEVVCVSGRWPGGTSAAVALPQELCCRLLPRCCRLYLDASTFWPYRIEWWGSGAASAGNALLLQMEFRRPRLHQPLPPERCAVEFAFKDGTPDAEDLTARVVENVLIRLR